MSAYMAANGSYLFVGTNQSTQVVELAKGQWTATTVPGFSPPITIAGITADVNGNVTVTFGAPGGASSGFETFSPTGALTEDGGGPGLILNDLNAVAPQPLPL